MGQGFGDQVVPLAEPDQDVNSQRYERLQPVRHRRRLDGQQVGGQLRGEFVRGLQGEPELALEHRGVDHEVKVVGPVQRVEVERALGVRRSADPPAPQPDSPLPSCGSRRTARRCGSACAAGDRRRGPTRATGPRRAALSPGAPTSPSRAGRDAGCRDVRGPQAWRARSRGSPWPRITREPGRGFTGPGVPQRPCGDVEQRVGCQRRDVDVVRVWPRPAPPWRRRRPRGRRPGRRCRRDRRWGSAPTARRSVGVRASRRGRGEPGRARHGPGPVSRPGRRDRRPPTPCCSSGRRRTRCPSVRSPDRGRAPVRARSSAIDSSWLNA